MLEGVLVILGMLHARHRTGDSKKNTLLSECVFCHRYKHNVTSSAAQSEITGKLNQQHLETESYVKKNIQEKGLHKEQLKLNTFYILLVCCYKKILQQNVKLSFRFGLADAYA